MVQGTLSELKGALVDIGRGGHLVCIMIGDFTVWPLSWFLEELKDRIKK